MITDDQIERAFTYREPDGEANDVMLGLEEGAKELAHAIVANTKPSREQSLAITKLEECIMWANKALTND